MTDDVTDATDETTDVETTAEEVEETTDAEETEETLGEPGKKALATERAAARTAKREAREAKAELAALKAQIAAKDKPTDEQELDRVRREATAEATQKSNTRILRSEIRAAAAGKLADPADAVAFLDLSEFDVDENGDVDASAIEDAITDLLTRKPHLAATGKRQFGNVNQSAKPQAKPGQLTQNEYNALSREERRKARDEGRVNLILGAK
jgi:benzoyl-CoA reductase/2-hydroxyglutaryl-CoA dehydratase subunit BcrC/BadD/HgdB